MKGGGSGLAQQIVLWGQKISMLGPSLCRTKASNIAKTPLALEKYLSHDAYGNAHVVTQVKRADRRRRMEFQLPNRDKL